MGKIEDSDETSSWYVALGSKDEPRSTGTLLGGVYCLGADEAEYFFLSRENDAIFFGSLYAIFDGFPLVHTKEVGRITRKLRMAVKYFLPEGNGWFELLQHKRRFSSLTFSELFCS